MTEINDALDKTLERERTKRTIYATACIIVSIGIVSSMFCWRVYPTSAYFLSGIPGAAFFVLGIYNIAAVQKSRIEPTRDQRFLANVFLTTAILGFPALVAVGIDVNAQANGTADAILHAIIGLALIVVAGIFRVIVAVNEAELRLRERLLSIYMENA